MKKRLLRHQGRWKERLLKALCHQACTYFETIAKTVVFSLGQNLQTFPPKQERSETWHTMA
jgi:hypothetical protein